MPWSQEPCNSTGVLYFMWLQWLMSTLSFSPRKTSHRYVVTFHSLAENRLISQLHTLILSQQQCRNTCSWSVPYRYIQTWIYHLDYKCNKQFEVSLQGLLLKQFHKLIFAAQVSQLSYTSADQIFLLPFVIGLIFIFKDIYSSNYKSVNEFCFH